MHLICDADLQQPRHAAALLALLDEYARGPTGTGDGLPPTVRERLVPQLQARPWAHPILAYADADEAAAPLGLLLAFEGFSSFAARPLLNIHDLVVTAPARGRGVGRRLMDEAEALARRLGCCKLTLEVLSGNAGAQALYRACGYGPYRLDATMGTAQFWQKRL